jgi:hypothetical protein
VIVIGPSVISEVSEGKEAEEEEEREEEDENYGDYVFGFCIIGLFTNPFKHS